MEFAGYKNCVVRYLPLKLSRTEIAEVLRRSDNKKAISFFYITNFAFLNSKSAHIYVRVATFNLAKNQNKVKQLKCPLFYVHFYVHFGSSGVPMCSLFAKIALSMHMRSVVEWQSPSFIKFKSELFT